MSREREKTLTVHNIALGMIATLLLGFGYWGVTRGKTVEEKAIAGLASVVGLFSVTSVLESHTQWLYAREQMYRKLGDQLEVQNAWDTKILPFDSDVSPREVALQQDVPASLKELSWDSFVDKYVYDPVLYPHFGVFAPTGFGKTLLLEVLGELRADYYKNELGKNCDLYYVSPTVDEDEFLGWTVVGSELGDNFKAEDIKNFGKYLYQTLITRYNDRKEATPIVVTLDEYRWQARNSTDLTDAVKEVLTIGRKKGFNVGMSAVGTTVSTLGMSGEGELRGNMTMILKGTIANDKMEELHNAGTVDAAGLVYWQEVFKRYPQRVCLVDGQFMMLPDMSQYRLTKTHANLTHSKALPYLKSPLVVEPEPGQNRTKSRRSK